MDFSGSLTLGGFTATSGYLHLRNTGLRAGGSFNLTAAGRIFNSSVGFDGAVNNDGTFSLAGNASLDIANIEMPSTPLTLGGGGVTATPTLKFGDSSGKLDFVPSDFRLTSASGVSFSVSRSFNQSLSIANSANKFASINFTVTLVGTGTGGELRLNGSATAFGYDVNFPSSGSYMTLGGNLQFWDYFGPPGFNCVEFDLAPLRAHVCDTGW